jgi:hypothetical protein
MERESVIYVDGRRTPLHSSDLAVWLKSLQSSSIAAIEIMGNPSAKYVEAGNACIINTRPKKDKSLGTAGSIPEGSNRCIYP